MTVLFLLLVMLIDLGARAYAGLSAISEGRGKSHRRFYLVIAALLMIGSFTSGISSILMNETPQGMGAFTKDISLSAIIIDFTSALMLAELLAASVRIRKLSRLGKHDKK
jgi:ABC-type thiamin/hydroxymethylpyrimidine transport system permease subunit